MGVFSQKVKVIANEVDVSFPIDLRIVNKSLELINLVFNLPEFQDSISKYSFVCTNKPILCKNNTIPGNSVYDDLINAKEINIDLKVKALINPWRRFISKTLGATNPSGHKIISYKWWLRKKKKDTKELTIIYASHLGHEIFHTDYFKYLHNPEYGSSGFVNEKDVTYKIDDIIEALIRKYYK